MTDSAETIAQAALLWLADDPERLGGFLGTSGLSPDALRARAAEPELLGFVLDYLLSEESWVLSFAQETGYRPEAAIAARAALPGGDTPHWT